MCPTPCLKGTTDLSRGWWDPHHVWYISHSLATDWPYCFRFPNFRRIMEWCGSKYGLYVHKLAKIVFWPSNFLGGTYEHSHRIQSISEHTTLCCKVLPISVQRNAVKERKRKGRVFIYGQGGTLKALRYGSHSFTCKQHHACLSFVSIHQMSPPQQLRQQTSNCSSLLIYRPERMKGWVGLVGLVADGWPHMWVSHPL